VNLKERDDLLRWSNDKISQIKLSEFFADGLVDRTHLSLGGSHTVVTYPPLDALEQVDADLVLSKITPVRDLSVYLHIAFCEFICPFCHYDTEYSRLGVQESDKTRTYIEALKTEICNWKELLKGSSIRSLYLGGGTPTALSIERLLELLLLFDTQKHIPDFTVCVETSPLTITADDGAAKLRSLVEAGVNRFSVGVQTFNERLLKRARGHGQRILLDALDIALGMVENVNIDLLQDLPDQDFDDILEDLDFIESLKPAQVTWYLLRLRPEAAWFKAYKRSRLELANSLESLQKRLLIREGMIRLGYRPSPGGRFIRDRKFEDKFKSIRSGLDSTLLGMGASAYSHGWGYFFRNKFSNGEASGRIEYVKRIRQYGFAIDSGCAINEVELVASKFVAGIRSGLQIPLSTPYTEQYLSEAQAILDYLERVGLVVVDEEGSYSLSDLGNAFEEEICALFYSPTIRNRLGIQSPVAGQAAIDVRRRQH
jgi:oxygen-independent coproporphyrinogen-3 oxidase